MSCAVRGGRLTLAGGLLVVSYLYRRRDMAQRDVRLLQGVVWRTYFDQFATAKQEEEEEEEEEEEILRISC